MISSSESGNIIFVNQFQENLSMIYNLIIKQKTFKLIIEQCPFSVVKFLNEKNQDEIGAEFQIIIRNEFFMRIKTICKNIYCYSQQITCIDNEILKNPFILNYSFHSNTNDNSTIFIIETNREIQNKTIKKIIIEFYKDFCKSINEYNKNYCISQIIFDSNVICRPFDTIKKNIHIFIEILSKFYYKKDEKNIKEKKNNFFITKETQILNEELNIYLQNSYNGDKIRLSIIALSEISCYIQLMEKFEYVSNGKIITKVSKLNQKLLKLIKEYFEHCFSL